MDQSDDNLYAFCKKVCQQSFSIGSGGIGTIREHVKGKRHLEMIKSAAWNQKITIAKPAEMLIVKPA